MQEFTVKTKLTDIEYAQAKSQAHQFNENTEFDDSYQKLLGQKEWSKLKPEIQKRFSVKPALGKKIVYLGSMQVRASFFGWLFAKFCRLIGRPLATQAGEDIPVVVSLAQNKQYKGTEWKRDYYFTGYTETIVSVKAIDEHGQLEEHTGYGFSMCLDVKVIDGNMHFISSKYKFRLGRFAMTLPMLITPGNIVVKHEQLENEFFRFTLEVNHPLLGQTFFQTGIFS